MTAQTVFTSALSLVGLALKPHRFRRRGSKLTRTGDEVLSLIELQRSQSSTASHLTFAINYGVAVLSLLQLEGVDATKLWSSQCHWGGRVPGREGVEAWWPVRDSDDPGQLAAWLTELVQRDVIPALNEKQREADLVTLWQTGRGPGPGFVAARRLLCLGQLLHRAGRHPEAVNVRIELETLPESPFTLRAAEKLKALEAASR